MYRYRVTIVTNMTTIRVMTAHDSTDNGDTDIDNANHNNTSKVCYDINPNPIHTPVHVSPELHQRLKIALHCKAGTLAEVLCAPCTKLPQ